MTTTEQVSSPAPDTEGTGAAALQISRPVEGAAVKDISFDVAPGEVFGCHRGHDVPTSHPDA